MLKRLVVACACVLVASTAAADTLVTWQADGTVTSRVGTSTFPPPGSPIAPPIGAPFSVTLTFDPESAVQTASGAMLPGCQTVSVSGSVTIGSYSTPFGSISAGYTQSNLPGLSRCAGGNQTHFELYVPGAPVDNPFKLPPGILFLSYEDLFVTDAFPNLPMPRFDVLGTYYANTGGVLSSVFQGRLEFAAVEQPTVVPEPGTMTLLALGLAAAYRRRRSAG
jgi:hypothetical protein